MKLLPDHAGSKDERSPVKILLVFLIASLLITMLIVYLVNFLINGKQ